MSTARPRASHTRTRAPRTWLRAPRTGPRSLRTRLVVSAVVLIAVVCTVIGSVTAIALRSHLYEQLDGSLGEVAMRAAGPPKELPDRHRPDDRLAFVTLGPQELGTIGAQLDGNGTIRRALVSTETDSGAEAGTDSSTEAETGSPADQGQERDQDQDQNQQEQGQGNAQNQDESPDRWRGPRSEAAVLTAAQRSALGSVARDGRPHSVELPGLGGYRVEFRSGANGSFLVGVPTEKVSNTLRTLLVVEVSVTAAGLVAATLAGTALASVALRPLRRVAATATRVSELPLHRGEVRLYERVPDADDRTEVGQVGAALNRMLDHVHEALDARQRSETRVRQFVADAGHELRTPLASILGYAELTRRSGEMTGPDTRHALHRIESEAERMTGLVADLLLLARLDSGRPLLHEPVDLAPLAVDALSDARAAGQEHHWRLELTEQPVQVRGDAGRLQQVLVNLLANARTHTPPGTTVTLRLRREDPVPGPRLVPGEKAARHGACHEDRGPVATSTGGEVEPWVPDNSTGPAASSLRDPAAGPVGGPISGPIGGPHLLLDVEDNGPGIPAPLLGQVFERFVRGDTSRSRAAGSTGLGLALVRAVARAHGGEVTVTSRPGRTVFTLRLPAAAYEDPEAYGDGDGDTDAYEDTDTYDGPEAYEDRNTYDGPDPYAKPANAHTEPDNAEPDDEGAHAEPDDEAAPPNNEAAPPTEEEAPPKSPPPPASQPGHSLSTQP